MDMDLKKVESIIYLKYFGDGLWDIFIGMIIMNFGLGILLDLPYTTAILVPLAFAISRQIKAKITYPRIGYIKFKQTKRRLLVLFLANLLLLGMVVFTAFALDKDSAFVNWLKGNMNLVFALVFGGSMALVGFLTYSTRFYVYGSFVGMGIFISKWVGSLGLNFTISGSAVVAAGIVVLYLFIKSHPLKQENGN